MNLKASVTLLIFCSTAFGNDNPTDTQRIQGSWQLTSLVIDGKPDDVFPDEKIRIVDDRILPESDQPEEPTLFQLRRNKKANEIDFLEDVGDGKLELIGKGIYRLDNRKLILCFAFEEEDGPRFCGFSGPLPPRPIDFDAKRRIEGYNKAILTFTRLTTAN